NGVVHNCDMLPLAQREWDLALHIEVGSGVQIVIHSEFPSNAPTTGGRDRSSVSVCSPFVHNPSLAVAGLGPAITPNSHARVALIANRINPGLHSERLSVWRVESRIKRNLTSGGIIEISRSIRVADDGTRHGVHVPTDHK